jgi:hypothetical protein
MSKIQNLNLYKTPKGFRGKSKIIYEKKGMFSRSEVGVAIHEDEAKNFSFGLEIKWSQRNIKFTNANM